MRLYKSWGIISTLLLTVVLFTSSTTITIHDQEGYCKVFGGIYVEKTPNRADYRVYKEESEAFADMLVFEESNKLFADREGVWFFTKDRRYADYIIYYTDHPSKAHFSIYFTETESFIGCNP